MMMLLYRDRMVERRFIGWQARWDREARRVRFDRVYVAPRATGTAPTPPESPPSVQYPIARQVVTRSTRETSHTFHLIMTILTCGLWGFVWIAISIWHKVGPRKKTTTTVR